LSNTICRHCSWQQNRHTIYAKAAFTRFGVNGIVRSLMLVALKIALAMAAGIVLLAGSPEARTEKSVDQELQYDSELSVDGTTNRDKKWGIA
jgi:hypothetical protein